MSKALSLSEVKATFSDVVDQVSTTQERVTVTRNGRPVVVVVSVDDLEAIEETIAILSDPAARRAIEDARSAITAGDVADVQELQVLRGRLGAYRVVYEVTSDEVRVLFIDHRADIYRPR